MKSKVYYLLFILVLVLGFLFRLHRFDNPIADWHSWRQADTSAVSRNFLSNGFNLLHPKFDDLSNVASGLDNPNGYRFVEFPIYNLAQAGFFKLFGIFTLEEWGRLVSIFASTLSTLFIFLIIKKYNQLAGLIAASFFAFLPFSIYYGRAILPDESMVAASLGGIYFFQQWLSVRQFKIFYYLLSFLFTTVAFLLKPYALFFTLPMIFSVFSEFGLSAFKKWEIWFYFITLFPLLLWRLWMQNFPEGIPASNWLFNAGGIRFKGSFFYWIFADRVSRLILGYWGIGILACGFLQKFRKKEFLFFLSFIISSLLYLFTMAGGNVQHDYYQILIVPSIAIFLGLGGSFLLSNVGINKIAGRAVFVVFSIFAILFSWYFVRDYFNINNPSIIVAGQAVDKLTPKDAKVIANYNGDTSFLYQTKRKGWASFEKSLPDMTKLGAQYLALVNPKKEDFGIGKEYRIVSFSKDYILFDLQGK